MDDTKPQVLAPLPFQTELLFTVHARVHAPQVFGDCGDGLRSYFPVAEATVEGPRIRGKVLVGSGGDWLTVRRDGVQLIDVRATLQTDDGALIYCTYSGYGDSGEDGYAKLLAGIRPKVQPIRATARYQSGHPKYQWLNRLQCFKVGEADVAKLSLRYDVYALR